MIIWGKVKADVVYVANTQIMFCVAAYCHSNHNGTVLVSMCVHESMFIKNLNYLYRGMK